MNKNTLKYLKRLFTYKCDVYEFVNHLDLLSKATYQTLTLVYQNLDCRISYYNNSYINSTKNEVYNNKSTQYIRLFLQKGINIKPGSLIKIFKDNELVDTFENSSKPYIYTHHQEILLKSKDNFS